MFTVNHISAGFGSHTSHMMTLRLDLPQELSAALVARSSGVSIMALFSLSLSSQPRTASMSRSFQCFAKYVITMHYFLCMNWGSVLA